jgi:RNA polymerase sigma-70 factor (ECF subfamily)
VKDLGVNAFEESVATSLSLLDRVRSRDQTAWEKLVELYAPLVYRWCLRFGLQHADAADVGQEVFTAVARKIRDFRRDRAGDSFRGWLFAITRNKVRDLKPAPGTTGAGGSDIQRQMEQLACEREADSDSQLLESQPDEEKLLLQRALAFVREEFEPQTWNAFWKVFVDDMPVSDVAEELAMSKNAVYVAKSKILRRLKEEYAAIIDFHKGVVS